MLGCTNMSRGAVAPRLLLLRRPAAEFGNTKLPKSYKIKQHLNPTQSASANIVSHSAHHQQPTGARHSTYSQPISARPPAHPPISAGNRASRPINARPTTHPPIGAGNRASRPINVSRYGHRHFSHDERENAVRIKTLSGTLYALGGGGRRDGRLTRWTLVLARRRRPGRRRHSASAQA